MPIVIGTPESGYSAEIKDALPNATIISKLDDGKTLLFQCRLRHGRHHQCNPQQLDNHFQMVQNGKLKVMTLVGDQVFPTDIEPIICSADCPFTRNYTQNG